MNPSPEVRAEFHCHSIYSPDSLVRVEDLLAACQQKQIDKLAITDHNRLEGALRAHALDPQRVIIGEEIQTTEGEILGYFMREEIPAGLEPLEVIERLKDQGAFISVAHPFDTNRDVTHWKSGTLEAWSLCLTQRCCAHRSLPYPLIRVPEQRFELGRCMPGANNKH